MTLIEALQQEIEKLQDANQNKTALEQEFSNFIENITPINELYEAVENEQDEQAVQLFDGLNEDDKADLPTAYNNYLRQGRELLTRAKQANTQSQSEDDESEEDDEQNYQQVVPEANSGKNIMHLAIHKGCNQLLGKVLEDNDRAKTLLENSDPDYTPIDAAIASNNFEAFKRLFDQQGLVVEADVNNKALKQALLKDKEANRPNNENMANRIVDLFADNAQKLVRMGLYRANEKSTLFTALQAQNSSTIQTVIERGINSLSSLNSNMQTLLQQALKDVSQTGRALPKIAIAKRDNSARLLASLAIQHDQPDTIKGAFLFDLQLEHRNNGRAILGEEDFKALADNYPEQAIDELHSLFAKGYSDFANTNLEANIEQLSKYDSIQQLFEDEYSLLDRVYQSSMPNIEQLSDQEDLELAHQALLKQLYDANVELSHYKEDNLAQEVINTKVIKGETLTLAKIKDPENPLGAEPPFSSVSNNASIAYNNFIRENNSGAAAVGSQPGSEEERDNSLSDRPSRPNS